MKSFSKRFFSVALVICICMSMLPNISVEVAATTKITDASKVSGSDYSAVYGEKLDNVFQGKVNLFCNTSAKFPLGKSLDNSKEYLVGNNTISGYQCYIYAQAVYYYLFGDIPYHGTGISNYWSNSTRVLKNQATISYEKFVEAGVGVGAYLRTTANSDGSYSGSYGHSLIILTYDSEKITYLEGNADGYGLVRITIKTWKEFNNDLLTNKGRRVCHVVQCNDPAAQLCDHSYDGCGICESCGYTFKWEDTLTTADAGYYKVVADFTPRTDMPYSAADKADASFEEGEFVTVVGAVTNAFGNKWYKISYGNGKVGYVYHTYLEKDTYLDSCTSYPSYCTIKATADTKAMTLPCSAGTNADSAKVISVSKGSTYTAIKLVLNDQGNYWYQITTSDGKTAYLPASKLEFIETIYSDVTISGVKAPDNLAVGKAFTIEGKISSIYNDLYKVSAYVYSGTDITASSKTGGAETVNGKSYSLKGSTVDSKVKFNVLAAGKYTYVVYATYKSYYADTEKTAQMVTEKIILHSSEFTVGSTSTCSHAYEGIVTTPATCTENGVTTYTCSKCGVSYTEAIAATGHVYTSILTAPSCEEQGYTTYTCSGCGDSYTETLEAIGHNYECVDIKSPTCTEEGYSTYMCANCDHSYTDNMVAATGHSYGQWVEVKAPTTDEEGLRERVCETCGDMQQQPIDKLEAPDPDAAQVILENVEASSGQTITVQITAQNMPLVKSLKLDNFQYDSDALEFVSAKLHFEDALIKSWDKEKMSAIVAFEEHTNINGLLLTLTFHVKDGFEGSTTITCDVVAKQLEESGQEIELDLYVVPGIITEVSYIRGDVDGDGYVNSDDAIYLLYYTFNSEAYPLNQNGDLDGNGYVNSDDAIYLLYYTFNPEEYPLP